MGWSDDPYRLSTMRERSKVDNSNRSLEGRLECQRKHPERGRLCTRPLRKGWILQVEQVRQDIPREGKQLGQSLEVRRKAWEGSGAGGGGERRLPEAEWDAGQPGGFECQSEALRLGFLGHEQLCSELSFQKLKMTVLQRLEVWERTRRSDGGC